MRRFVVWIPAVLLVTSLGCASSRPPAADVAVFGESTDLRVLEGSWSGSYWSGDTGRKGPIRFALEVDDTGDVARGDVVMIAASGDPYAAANELSESPPPGTRRSMTETLAISFVEVDPSTETVSGTLEPYRDPECDCIVTTTFTGRVGTDSISGTFVTRGSRALGERRGEWRVDRADEPP